MGARLCFPFQLSRPLPSSFAFRLQSADRAKQIQPGVSAAHQSCRRGDSDQREKSGFGHEALARLALEITGADFTKGHLAGTFAGATGVGIESRRVIIAVGFQEARMRARGPNVVRVALTGFSFRKYRFHNFLSVSFEMRFASSPDSKVFVESHTSIAMPVPQTRAKS